MPAVSAVGPVTAFTLRDRNRPDRAGDGKPWVAVFGEARHIMPEIGQIVR